MGKRGPKATINPRREYWRVTMQLTPKQCKVMRESFFDQLDRCKSPEAQRLIIRGLTGGV